MEDAMAKSTDLPKVVILKAPPVYHHFEQEFTRHFNFLKAWESPLSIGEFLAAVNDAGATAMFVNGLGPPITAASILDYFPSLRCIVTSTTGVDYIDVLECRRRGIVIANAADMYSDDCAEEAVALLIDVLRKISAADRYVRSGDWSIGGEYGLGRRLRGKKVGIVGLGNIGSKVAIKLQPFVCTILYTSRTKKPSLPYSYYSDIAKLAIDSDFLVICCPLTDETHHLIDNQVMSALGKDGVIVNIGRGAIVDEKELVRALQEGDIAGAGLDVFENEPRVPKELFDMNNVVLSPHVAFCTAEAFRDMFELVKGNLQAFFSNKPLISPFED